MDWGFSILLFPLHLLGELIKPLSLALRLFGNIFGEDTLVATMVILGYVLMKADLRGDGGFVALPAGHAAAVAVLLPGAAVQHHPGAGLHAAVDGLHCPVAASR